ncbi:hypothetical protein K1T71_009516 [Dendrolimus kikuchii]|uniref:Uncharacterized protein n=1 Tax=Dendrolimus kikuchii TaxID=765133 RepID=A0ACC1CRT7_9NEOP|nr:hypothetical protein K1T71_009516 [Dendrolimus kikuchii]
MCYKCAAALLRETGTWSLMPEHNSRLLWRHTLDQGWSPSSRENTLPPGCGMQKEDAEAIRQDISSVLRRSRLPKPNLTRAEYIALKNIRNKPEITVLRADKGNATVVMDTSDYNSKIQDLLSDESTYKKVKTDPTDKVTKQTIAVMKKHSEKLSLDVSALTPSCAKAPKLYGLPKIHKNNIALRT